MIKIILFVIFAIYLWYSCKCVTYIFTFQGIVKKHMSPKAPIESNYVLPMLAGLIFGGFIMMFFSKEMHKEIIKSILDHIRKQLRVIPVNEEQEIMIDRMKNELENFDISFYCTFFSKK